jgi:phytoene dehydrogenase-like protein
MPFHRAPSAAAGILLAVLAHGVGWPFPRGGAQSLAVAMASILRSLGGAIETGHEVRSLDELPRARVVFLDLTPAQILRIGGDRLPSRYRRGLRRFAYGPGACKIDLALDGPVPWANPLCHQTACVHLGGSFDEIARSEEQVWRGEHPEQPYVLVAQHCQFDDSRAPAGKHTLWAYCHVPNGSTVDVSGRIEAQIERFAPGFRERILARHTTLPADLERGNHNLVGGDINGGAQTLRQMLARPVLRWNPYTTPVEGLYVCSASTPPGGGVHGLCGHLAALTALAKRGVAIRRRRGTIRRSTLIPSPRSTHHGR